LTYSHVATQRFPYRLLTDRIIFHTIVRLISSFEDELARRTLEELANQNVLFLASAALRGNDVELKQWMIFMCHEFVVRRKIPFFSYTCFRSANC
jgi:hypothetical protein